MARIEQLVAVTQSSSAPLVGPIPEIDALLAQKPNARIAVVQGSFDWFHSGHVALVENVAAAKIPGTQPGSDQPFDLVVVIPTRRYDRKPYLRNSFERRIELARNALNSLPNLRGRVVVSDAMRELPNRPTELMQSLVATYPGAHFAYCLGADSFNDSADYKRWPNFAWVEQHVDLFAVNRGGYQVENTGRATSCITGAAVTISSTEIRNAIYNNDVESLVGRVPETTLKAIREAARARETDRRAGTKLMGIVRPSEQSFAALRGSIPAGAINLLDLLEEKDVPENVREHLATLQQRINEGVNERKLLSFFTSKKQMSKESGFSDKLVLDAKAGTRLADRYLYKPMQADVAAKVEFVSVLANLVGIPTPLVLTHEHQDTRTEGTNGHGVSIKLIDDVVDAHPTKLGYDYGKAEPKVIEYFMLSRWINEVVGNLDCWGAQFLVPKNPANRYKEIVTIDLDEAFNRFPTETLYDALVNHFGLTGIQREDCVWRDREYVFSQPVGWAPDQFDSTFTVYGPLFKAYMEGTVDLPIEAIKEKVRFVRDLPQAAVINCMRKYLGTRGPDDVTTWGVRLPASATGVVSKPDFERLFVKRLYDSTEQFCTFLDELKTARTDPDNPMHQFYLNLKPRPY